MIRSLCLADTTAVDSSPDPARSGSAAEQPPGWILWARTDACRSMGPVRPLLRHVPDGRAVPLDEVSR